MTPKEALDWCEQFTDNLVMANVDTKKRTLGLQAMQTIKSALEKQIPKKPIPKLDKVWERVISYTCPTCGNGCLGNCEYIFDCCEYCGQALDWSDTE
jgi:hypothetical protein